MIRFLIKFYVYIIILDTILSFFPATRHYSWAQFVRKVANYTLKPVREIMPKDLPFDLSPLVVIFILNLLMLLW